MLSPHEDVHLDGPIEDGERDRLMEEGPSVTEQSPAQAAAAAAGPCGCLSVGYYQPFFDVDTKDVRERLLGTLTFYQAEPTFLAAVSATPDAYGPFWTATTLIFVISATSNLSGYLSKGYTYDFELVTFCASSVYGFVTVAPAALWAAMKYFMGLPVGFMPLFCLYGYSLFLFIPCTLLATISLFSWPALGLALIGSTLFLLRSIVPIASARKEKAMTLIACIVAAQIIFTLILKIKFYSHS